MKMNVFIEDNETYIHVPVRSGLFQIQLDQDTVADFLADLEKTGRKRKSTVYKFVGLSKPPTRTEVTKERKDILDA